MTGPGMAPNSASNEMAVLVIFIMGCFMAFSIFLIYMTDQSAKWRKRNPPVPKWQRTKTVAIKTVKLPVSRTFLDTPEGLESLYFESEEEARRESDLVIDIDLPPGRKLWWPKAAVIAMEEREKPLDFDGRWV